MHLLDMRRMHIVYLYKSDKFNALKTFKSTQKMFLCKLGFKIFVEG